MKQFLIGNVFLCIFAGVYSKSLNRQVNIRNVWAQDNVSCQMTVMIEPGDDYCFFVPNITTGQQFEFDFQVFPGDKVLLKK